MRMEVYVALLAVAIVMIAVHLFVIPLDRLFLLFAETADCQPGDPSCLEIVNEMRENCTTSVSVITVGNGTNNITIQLVTYLKDGKCVTEETVLEDANSGIAPFDITGYNTTCEIEEEKFEMFGQKACNGSLASFIAPSEDGGGGETGEDDGEVYTAYCSLDADDCKEEAAEHITECQESEITMDMQLNHTQGGTTYWTLFIEIDRLPVEYTETEKLPERCRMYHELINAVNLPPEIPPSIVGMSMTCTIELYRFPINSVTVRFCEGDLMDYIKLIYP